MEKPFSIGESLSFGWATLKAHSALVFKVVLTLLALEVALQIVSRVLAGTGLGFVASVVLVAALVWAGIGATLLSLKLAEHKAARFGDILPELSLSINYVLANLLAGVITIMPLIIGGIAILVVGFASGAFILHAIIGVLMAAGMLYFMVRYSMVRFAALDGKGVTDSVRYSAAITHGHKWRLLWFIIVMLLLNILGAIVLLVGLLISIPVTMLAYAHVYTKLKGN